MEHKNTSSSADQNQRTPRQAFSRNYDSHANSHRGGYIIPQYGKRAAQRRAAIRSFVETLVMILIIGVIVVSLRLFVVTQYIIPSASMADTLPVGSHVLANKLMRRESSLKRGYVIVFRDTRNWLSSAESSQSQGFLGSLTQKITGDKTGQGYLIKRIIGLPGDTVSCKGSGYPIMVNGHPIKEPYLKTGVNPSDVAFRVTVTAGNIFVMGDNRSNSADSRFHTDDGNNGLVPISAVAAVAVAVVWPLSQWKTLTSETGVFAGV